MIFSSGFSLLPGAQTKRVMAMLTELMKLEDKLMEKIVDLITKNAKLLQKTTLRIGICVAAFYAIKGVKKAVGHAKGQIVRLVDQIKSKKTATSKQPSPSKQIMQDTNDDNATTQTHKQHIENALPEKSPSRTTTTKGNRHGPWSNTINMNTPI